MRQPECGRTLQSAFGSQDSAGSGDAGLISVNRSLRFQGKIECVFVPTTKKVVMKRIADLRVASDEVSPAGDQYVEAFERVEQLESLVSGSEQGDDQDSDNLPSQAGPLHGAIDHLATQLAQANDELQQLREANQTLTSRLDAVEQDCHDVLAGINSRPNLGAFRSIRDELHVAHELLNETRAKYDQAVTDLIQEFDSATPSDQGRASAESRSCWQSEAKSSWQTRLPADESDVRENRWEDTAASEDVAVEQCDSAAERDSGRVKSTPQMSSIWASESQSLKRDWLPAEDAADPPSSTTVEDRNDAWSGLESPDYDPTHLMSVARDAAACGQPSGLTEASDADNGDREQQARSKAELWSRFADDGRRAVGEAKNDSTDRQQFQGPEFQISSIVADGESVPMDADCEADDAMKTYIDHLLGRVPRDTDDAISEDVSKLISRSTLLNETGWGQTGSDAGSTLRSAIPDLDLAPRSVAPETQSDLTAMRDLANASARARSRGASTLKRGNSEFKAGCNSCTPRPRWSAG